MITSTVLTMILFLTSTHLAPGAALPQDDELSAAEQAYKLNDYETAVKIYREVIRKDAGNIRALKRLARLHATASDPDYFDGKRAVELALMAHDEAPDDPEVVEILALGFFAQNKFERAILECERCIALNKYNTVHFELMRKIAKTWLDRLDMAQPGDESLDKGRAAFYYGKALLLLDEPMEAAEQLTRAYHMDPKQEDVTLFLARAKLALGDPEGAIEVIENPGEVYGSDFELLTTLGTAYMESVLPENAVSCFEKAYELSPDSPGIRQLLGDAYIEAGKFVKAVVILKEAQEKLNRKALFAKREEAEILMLLGKALAGGGEVEDGLARVLDALALEPDLAEAEDLLTFLYTQRFGSLKGMKEYLLLLAGEDSATFVESSEKAGIVHAGRPAFGDYDNDGDPDLLVAGTWLYENKGRGVFEDVTEKMRLDEAKGVGGIWGDYDNDGDLDIYVMNDKKGLTGRLFENRGRKGFQAVKDGPKHPTYLAPTLSAVFGDVNRDGWLDLYLASGLASHDVPERGFADALFLGSRHDGFRHANKEFGLDRFPAVCTMSVNLVDFDGDGDQDILALHDELMKNNFLVNPGEGILLDEAIELGLAGVNHEDRYGNSMAAVFGDIDNDGDFDAFIANHAEPADLPYSDRSQLLINSGRPDYRFTDQTDRSGITYSPHYYQPVFCDFNNDGLLDLFVTCNHTGEVCRYFEGREDGTFEDRTWLAGLVVKNATYCAVADIDADGDEDLFVEAEGKPLLFVNESHVYHWIGIRLQGQSCNATGIGARVTVDFGTRCQTREVSGGRGAGCQDDMTLLFGLGEHAGRVGISVQWPDGRSSFESGMKPDKYHLLKGKK